MKKLFFTLCVLFLGFHTFAQSVLEKSLTPLITEFNNAKNREDFKLVKEKFQSQISENSDWHYAYYAALANLKEAETLRRDKKFSEIDVLTDNALISLNSLSKLESSNSEIRALRAYLHVLRLSVNPTERFSTEGKKASELLYLAQNIDQKNPRFDLIRAQLEYFNNGKSVKSLFQGALSKLKSTSPKSKIDPNWGLNDAEYYVSILK